MDGGQSSRHRLGCRALGALVLRSADPAGHRRNVPAQRDHLARQDSSPPPCARTHVSAHDDEPALAAPGAAHQLLRPGRHRLRAQVSRTPGSPRCSASANIWRSIIHRIAGVLLIADGVYHVFYVVAHSRRTPADPRPVPHVEGRHRRLGNDALLPRPAQGKAQVRPLQLRREGRVLGAGLGHRADGRHRHHAVGQGLRSATCSRAGGSTPPPPCTSTRPFWPRWRSWSGTSTRSSSIPMSIR